MSSSNHRLPEAFLPGQEAQNLPLKKDVLICGPVELKNAVATTDAAVGAAVSHLKIILFFPVSYRSLGLYLTLVPNIVHLDLSITSRQPTVLTSLAGLQFPHLRLFETNYAHKLLPDFLVRHRGLAEVRLFTCGSVRDCPLRALDLAHITAFAGPSDCIVPHVHPRCSRVLLSLSTPQCRSPSILLRKITPPLQHLHALILDFYPHEHDILDAIIAAAPRLQKLKLWEAADNGRRRMARRPWNDGVAWGKALRRLPLLEELVLRTASSFVQHAADVDDERKTIMRWVHGARKATSNCGHPHPMLHHVGVWYKAVVTGTRVSSGVISHWSKPTGEWERTVHLINSNPSLVVV